MVVRKNTAQDTKTVRKKKKTAVSKKKAGGKNIGKVSAAETQQKGSTKSSSVSTQKGKKTGRTEEEKNRDKQNMKSMLFIGVREWGDALQKKFPDYDYRKICLVVFENLPECENISLSDFSEEFEISRQSCYNWKVDDEYEKIRTYFIRKHLKEGTSKVVAALLKGASFSGPFGPNVQAIKLFLQYAENWKEGLDLNHDVKGGFNVTFGVDPSPYMKPEDSQQKEDSDDAE